MITEHNRILLHLSLIEGVGVAGIHKILRFLINEQRLDNASALVDGAGLQALTKKLDLTACYQMTVPDWQRAGFTIDLAGDIVQNLRSNYYLDQELLLLQKHTTIFLVTLLDESYPLALRHINLPPPLLYVQGRLDAHHPKRLAIIGSRLADSYAQKIIDMMVPALVMHGWQIVSGGARGADTMAHAATLQAKGQTIVVLGSGLLNPYPEQNIPLFDAVVKAGGCVVSCFRLEATPERHNFPIRNRIIAGLSGGCLVVQAAIKSGALITAEFALEQGRQVFAVPGSIFHSLSEGTHKLLGMGAKLVAKVTDIFEEFGDVDHDDSKAQLSILPAQSKATTPLYVSPPVLSVIQSPELPEETDPILKILAGSMSIDQLSVKTGIELVDLQDQLFMLQLDGKARQTFSGLWERVVA